MLVLFQKNQPFIAESSIPFSLLDFPFLDRVADHLKATVYCHEEGIYCLP
jgi:hypothetical protein